MMMENYLVHRMSLDEMGTAMAAHEELVEEQPVTAAAMRLARKRSWNDHLEEDNRHNMLHFTGSMDSHPLMDRHGGAPKPQAQAQAMMDDLGMESDFYVKRRYPATLASPTASQAATMHPAYSEPQLTLAARTTVQAAAQLSDQMIAHHQMAAEQMVPMRGHGKLSRSNTALAEQAIRHSQLVRSHSVLTEDSILEEPVHPRHSPLTGPVRSHPVLEHRTQSLPQMTIMQAAAPMPHTLNVVTTPCRQTLVQYQPSPFQTPMEAYGLAPQPMPTSPQIAPTQNPFLVADSFCAPAMMGYSPAGIPAAHTHQQTATPQAVSSASSSSATSSATLSPTSPPSSQSSQEDNSVAEAEETSADGPTAKPKCNICFETLEELKSQNETVVSTPCGHLYCESCLKGCLQTMKKCPLCRRKLGNGRDPPYHKLFF